MRRALPAFCFSLLALCCISAQAQEKTEGDSNGLVSDKVVQSMFYKAQHQETGNMWDVWLFHHEGTYFLYYLANVGEHRWRWDNISMATSPDGVHWKVLASPRVIDDEEKGEVGVGDQRTERSDRYLRDRCSREDVAVIALC